VNHEPTSENAGKPPNWLRRLSNAALLFAAVSAVFTLYCFWELQKENHLLREQALAVTLGVEGRGDKVEVLNDWVYHNQGFAKNQSYFLLKALGPTPEGVLRRGGDCSDKSRLLSAMLAQIGIDSSLAMQYPCPDCEAVHTVVYAETESGVSPFDPVYNISFPDGQGGFLTVPELARSYEAMTARLDQLIQERGEDDKIVWYDAPTHHFEFATTVNWDKNALTRAFAGLLEFFDIEPTTFFRPHFLESPKLALSIAGLFATLGFAFLAWLLRLYPSRV